MDSFFSLRFSYVCPCQRTTRGKRIYSPCWQLDSHASLCVLSLCFDEPTLKLGRVRDATNQDKTIRPYTHILCATQRSKLQLQKKKVFHFKVFVYFLLKAKCLDFGPWQQVVLFASISMTSTATLTVTVWTLKPSWKSISITYLPKAVWMELAISSPR